MAITLDEVLWRVDDLEQKKIPYRTRADKWQSLWELSVFKTTPAEALAGNSQEQVTLPDPRNVVEMAQRLISSEPRIEIPSGAATAKDDNSSDKRERYLTGFWQRVNQEQQREVLADAAWQALVRGRFCFEVKWVRDMMPKIMRDKRLPILVRTLDPFNVGIKRGPLWTDYAYHKYQEERTLVRQRYKKVKEGSRNGRWAGVDLVDVIDFWYHEADGSVWNAVIVEDEFVVNPTKTNYPDIPIIEGYGAGAPLPEVQFRGMSILDAIVDLYPYKCRLASQVATGLLYYFWPAILIENENGIEVPDIDVKPGTTTQLPMGVHVNMLRGDVNMPLATSMMQLVDQGMQMSTFPGVMYGQAPGEIQAGYGISLLADQARGKVNMFRKNLETALSHVNSLILGLIEENAGSKGVSLWGRSQRDGTLYSESLTPKDIDGMYENLVTLIPDLPTDEAQRLTLWMRMVDQGIVSKKTMRDKAIKDPLPTDEQLRVQIERLWESEPMQGKAWLNAIRTYSPDDWQDLVAGTPLQQLAMQEEVAPPGYHKMPDGSLMKDEEMSPGNQGQGPSPMAPQGPPPGMAPPQGPPMPQGPMPPQMPPPGPMPQGPAPQMPQLPPELQALVAQIPPNVRAQLEQQGITPEEFILGMVEQEMQAAQQGGQMPQGPGQMQPQGMVGIPGEELGQLSDESLGIPPGQQGMGMMEEMMGNPLPPGVQDDMMLGMPPTRNAKGRARSRK